MSRLFGLAAAAGVLVIVAVLGLSWFSGRTSLPGASPTPAPTVAPPTSPLPSNLTSTAPSSEATQQPSPTSSGLALTEPYVSDVHGIAVKYPAGWHVQPATTTWTSGGISQDSAFADVIYQQSTDTPFIALASQPLGGKTPEAWTNQFFASYTGEDACTATEPYVIDGSQGTIGHCGIGPLAVVAAGDRAHVIWLYRISDMDWFKQILDTVQLDPAAAQVAGPSPSGLALTESYTSTEHGITVSYPAGWHLQPATQPWTNEVSITQESPYADVIYQQATDSAFIAITSHPLGGKTAQQWAASFLASWTGSDGCGATEPYTIDGKAGVVAECGIGPNAVVSAGGRAYVIWVYSIHDMDWFKQILDTVQLNPSAAV